MGLSRQNTSSATLVLLVGTLIGRVLGLAVQIIIASLFGTTAATDAYFVAFGFLTALASPMAGTFTMTMIPILSDYLAKEGKQAAIQASGVMFSVTLIVFGIATAICLGAATPIVRVLAPGFSPETTRTASLLLAIMSPTVLFLALNAMQVSVFHSFRHFLVPTIASFGIDLAVILSALTFSSRFGISSLAAAVSIGAAVRFLFPFSVLARKRYVAPLSLDFSHPAVRKVTLSAVPVSIASSVFLINLLLDRGFASVLGPGSVGALEFAVRVVSLPVIVFGGAVSTAVFPTLSSLEARKKTDQFRETLSLALRMLIWVGIPSSVGLIVLRTPIVRLLFERGSFGADSTRITSIALLNYSLGVVAYMLNVATVRAYFSLKDAITPLKIVGLIVGINALLKLALIRLLGLAGIPLATSIASTLGIFFLLEGLRRRIGSIGGNRILVSGVKTILASILMGVVCWAIYPWLCRLVSPPGVRYQLLQVGGALAAGVVVFMGCSTALRSDEARRALALATRFRKDGAASR